MLAVGVFVDAPLSEMTRIVEEAGIDALQLHGDEPPESLRQLPVPAVKAFRPRPGTDAARVVAEINRYRSSPSPPLGILVDGYTEEVSGGTGVACRLAARQRDWRHIPDPARRADLIQRTLAPRFVQVRPLGVDVSSGVEIDGVKAAARIEEFIRAARQAFQELGALPLWMALAVAVATSSLEPSLLIPTS